MVSIKISVKEGDMIHWHFKSWNDVFRIQVAYHIIGQGYEEWSALLWTNQPEGSRDTKQYDSETIFIEFKNVDNVDNTTGHIRIFVIVYDDHYPPTCPLC